MRNLFAFIYRFRAFLVFLLLEVLSIYLLVQNNSYQNAAFYNSANTYAGKVLELQSNVTDYFRLKTANEALVAENAALKESLNRVLQLNDDTVFGRVDSILVHLDSASKPVPYHFIGAKVINNSVRRANNHFTLNVGSKQGIRPGMGVLAPQGVAGRVKAVSANYATVASLLHSQTLISAKLKRDGTFGTIKWDPADGSQVASLHYVPLHVKVQKGDTVYTSGYNSLFPEGVLIGKVTSVRKEADKSFFTIKVNLAVDFSKLGFVYVVQNLRQIERDSLEIAATGKEEDE
ncbi:MAG TPA: rod shape-determining protein MreC [Adhaeribacter sp.]|nr:rod shape-determining protein MreC [Adhaeribacter sp.]